MGAFGGDRVIRVSGFVSSLRRQTPPGPQWGRISQFWSSELEAVTLQLEEVTSPVAL